jgi:hypothetical protein
MNDGYLHDDFDPKYYYDMPYVAERDYTVNHPVEYFHADGLLYARMPFGGAYVPIDSRCLNCQFFVRRDHGRLEQVWTGLIRGVAVVWEDYPNSTIVLHIACKRERG